MSALQRLYQSVSPQQIGMAGILTTAKNGKEFFNGLAGRNLYQIPESLAFTATSSSVSNNVFGPAAVQAAKGAMLRIKAGGLYHYGSGANSSDHFINVVASMAAESTFCSYGLQIPANVTNLSGSFDAEISYRVVGAPSDGVMAAVAGVGRVLTSHGDVVVTDTLESMPDGDWADLSVSGHVDLKGENGGVADGTNVVFRHFSVEYILP